MDDRTMARFLAKAAAGDPHAQRMVARMRQSAAATQAPHPSEFALPSPNANAVPPIQLDQVHPPQPGNFVHPVMAPSRIFTLEPIPVVPAGTTSQPVRLEFDAGPGWLIGMRGTVIDYSEGAQAAGEFERANIGLRIFINDGEDIITNGTRTAYARYSDLFPPASLYTPILRWMYATDDLYAEFRNFHPTVDLQPSLSFLYWREKYPGT